MQETDWGRRLGCILAAVLVLMGLTVVGFFVFISIALESWGNNK